jgi:type I pantothenate kinase
MNRADDVVTPFLEFSRDEWRSLRAATPLTLSAEDLAQIQGINERLSLSEVEQIYLPLTRLLDLYLAALNGLHQVRATFLSRTEPAVPFVIGIAGSVAVGKSTVARILQTLLSRWPGTPRVALVTTDGFLLPNPVLTRRGILQRKGFPESYDLRALLSFIFAVKSGQDSLRVPVYSHLSYDIVPDEWQHVEHPDIVILEGLNILQVGRLGGDARRRVFVSDFLDFSIYVDADEDLIRRWYIERFFTLRDTAFRNEASYFHRFSVLSDHEAEEVADAIWRETNSPNLRENILPTRERAHLILRKGDAHRVEGLWLRKI